MVLPLPLESVTVNTFSALVGGVDVGKEVSELFNLYHQVGFN